MVAANRNGLHHARVLDARQCAQPLEQPIEQRGALMILGIAALREPDGERQNVFGPEAGIDIREPGEAAQQQGRANQQDDP